MKLYKNFLLLGFFALIVVVSIVVLILEESNKITGNVVDTQVEVIQVESKACSFTLYPGWNMVSFYCFGMFVNRSVGLDSLDNSYNALFTYRASDSSDPWKSYNSSLPSWTVQQINYMDRISGYWIFITNESNFTYQGLYSNSVIPLYSGWNFIGYPKNISTNINDTMNGIAFSIIRHYNISSDTWIEYINGGPSNTLILFDTYDGYWVNVTSNANLNISK